MLLKLAHASIAMAVHIDVVSGEHAVLLIKAALVRFRRPNFAHTLIAFKRNLFDAGSIIGSSDRATRTFTTSDHIKTTLAKSIVAARVEDIIVRWSGPDGVCAQGNWGSWWKVVARWSLGCFITGDIADVHVAVFASADGSRRVVHVLHSDR